MAKFGRKNIIKILAEYKHPDANGEYGSVTLMQTDEKISGYTVAVDFDADNNSWSRAYSLGVEQKAIRDFDFEVEKINKRVSQEIAIQRIKKTVKESFRSMYWLELEGEPSIVLCRDYMPDAEAGKQWRWGRLRSWLPENAESAKTIFTWEVIKLAQKKPEAKERVFDAKNKIIEQYYYLALIALFDNEGGFALYEDGTEDGLLAYFTRDEERFARWAFEERKVNVDRVIDRIETMRQYELKTSKLRNAEMRVLGFTSCRNAAIEEMDCDVEQNLAGLVLVKYMQEHGLKLCGEHHKHGDDGVPVFNNGKKFVMSMRSWGGLMADVLNLSTNDDDDDDDDMSYCKWAWQPPEDEDEVYPSHKGIKVYADNEAVAASDIDSAFDVGFDVDTRPSAAEMQRFFAQHGYFKMPRVMTPQQLLEEIENENKKRTTHN